MKKTIIGITLLLSATLTDISIIISSAILATTLTEWNTNSGKLWTALIEYKLLIPFILSNTLLLFAIIILLKEYFDKEESTL